MEDVPALDKKYKSTIEAVVDRLILKPDAKRSSACRLTEAVELAPKSAQAWCGSKTSKATVNSTPNTALVRSTGSPSLPSNRAPSPSTTQLELALPVMAGRREPVR